MNTKRLLGLAGATAVVAGIGIAGAIQPAAALPIAHPNLAVTTQPYIWVGGGGYYDGPSVSIGVPFGYWGPGYYGPYYGGGYYGGHGYAHGGWGGAGYGHGSFRGGSGGGHGGFRGGHGGGGHGR